jgi:formylglycine-generating enzyme required for sulfatase activity
VPGGAYYRTYDLADGGSAEYPLQYGGPTGEADPATVSGFRLDKYLVTVGRFRRFVNTVYRDGGVATADAALAWTPEPGSGKHVHLNGGQGLANNGPGGGYETGWVAADDSNIPPTDAVLSHGDPATWTAVPGAQENLPINTVNWYEAYAFCIWDGGFLPSEAEWGYAAAGGSQQRAYPWGSEDPGAYNEYAIYDCYYPDGGSEACSGTASNVAPVGTAPRGAGLWGQLDMEGEVSEWILDWYQSRLSNPCRDCGYLTPAGGRVWRGGDFMAPVTYIASPVRVGDPPADINSFVGFRCARTP